MKIIVDKVSKIKPTLCAREFALHIDVELTNYQREKLFYNLWEYIEDDGLEKLLKAEGYELKKIE